MNKEEAMKLALEALGYIYEGANKQGPHTGISWRCVSNKAEPAITALREALAEPQEKYIYGTPLLDAMTGKANEALDKKAQNARELGLDYEPAQQEPVAMVCHDLDGHIGWNPNLRQLPDEGTALYTSPPAQRTWVDLTDDEIKKEFHPLHATGLQFARAVLAKSKEKNA